MNDTRQKYPGSGADGTGEESKDKLSRRIDDILEVYEKNSRAYQSRKDEFERLSSEYEGMTRMISEIENQGGSAGSGDEIEELKRDRAKLSEMIDGLKGGLEEAKTAYETSFREINKLSSESESGSADEPDGEDLPGFQKESFLDRIKKLETAAAGMENEIKKPEPLPGAETSAEKPPVYRRGIEPPDPGPETHRLKQTLEKYKKEVSILQEENAGLSDELARHRSGIFRVEQQGRRSHSESERLASALETREKKIREMSSELEEISAELAANEKRLKTLYYYRNEDRQEKEALTEEIKALASDIEKYRSGNETLIRENEHLRLQIREHDSEAHTLKARNADLEAKSADLETLLGDSRSEAEHLRSETEKYREDIEFLETRIRDLETRLKAAEDKNSEFEGELGLLEAENRELTEKGSSVRQHLTALEKDTERMRAEIVQLNEALEVSGRKEKELEDKIRGLEAENRELTEKGSSDRQHLTALEKDTEMMRAEIARLNEALEVSGRKEKELEDKIRGLEAENRELTEKGSSARQNLTALEKDTERMRGEIARLNEALEVSGRKEKELEDNVKEISGKISEKNLLLKELEVEKVSAEREAGRAVADFERKVAEISARLNELEKRRDELKSLLNGKDKELLRMRSELETSADKHAPGTGEPAGKDISEKDNRVRERLKRVENLLERLLEQKETDTVSDDKDKTDFLSELKDLAEKVAESSENAAGDYVSEGLNSLEAGIIKSLDTPEDSAALKKDFKTLKEVILNRLKEEPVKPKETLEPEEPEDSEGKEESLWKDLE